MGVVKKRCATCGSVKSINARMNNCADCLRKKREEKWKEKKEEICSNPEDREYMLKLPLGNGFVCVFVNPFKSYGAKTGKELMKDYLHKNWNKGTIAQTDNARKSKSMNKIIYDGLTRRDIERIEKLGNVLDDYTFEKYKRKLDSMSTPEERRRFISSFEKFNDNQFITDNECKLKRYKSPDKQREIEDVNQIQEEDNTSEWGLDDTD